ncbi:hypothetical protein ACWEQ2_29255 [Streptomyces sp. NPDC004096]
MFAATLVFSVKGVYAQQMILLSTLLSIVTFSFAIYLIDSGLAG